MNAPDRKAPLPTAGLLPHRPPMLLVESILERGAGFVACRGRITRDTPLAGESGISSLLGLELGAQASALLDPEPADPAPRAGYLVFIRRATLHRATLPLAVPLRVEARLLGGAGGLRIVQVRIAPEEEPDVTLAEGELGTFVPPAP